MAVASGLVSGVEGDEGRPPLPREAQGTEGRGAQLLPNPFN